MAMIDAKTRKIAENTGTTIPLSVVPNNATPKKDPILPAARDSPKAPPLKYKIPKIKVFIWVGRGCKRLC